MLRKREVIIDHIYRTSRRVKLMMKPWSCVVVYIAEIGINDDIALLNNLTEYIHLCAVSPFTLAKQK